MMKNAKIKIYNENFKFKFFYNFLKVNLMHPLLLIKPQSTNSQKFIQFSLHLRGMARLMCTEKELRGLGKRKRAAGEGKQLNKITLPFTR